MAPPAKKVRLSNGTLAPTERASIVPHSDAAVPTVTEKDRSQQRSLFVRSLPTTTTTEILTDLFSQSYPIKHATAVTDKVTKQCKGYGFVTFADAEDAQRAKEAFNGFVLEGKKLRVEVAEPRHRDTAAGSAVSAVALAKAAREKERTEQKQPPKLIVRNLPWSIKQPDQLAKLFLSYGKIKYATIPRLESRLQPGFGFVTLRGRKNAEKALEGVNGKEVDGRILAVDWAVEKEVWSGMQDRETAGSAKEETTEDVEVKDEQDDIDEDGFKGNDASDSNEGESDENADQDIVENERDVGIKSDGDTKSGKTEDRSQTLFIRNLPFSCTDEDLEDHFAQFGAVRYARVVLDPATERSRGTGFVCYYNVEDADACLKGAPRNAIVQSVNKVGKDTSTKLVTHSILQNEDTDPSGRYTLDGRTLQISRAVDKSEAARLTQEGATNRFARDKDKRCLYLLSEGTIATNSPLYEKLPPSERTMRESSAKQRKMLIESNPSLHLSLTRLAVRNIPRSITSKDLKALAREAVVGFATDIKAGVRTRLSKEELQRGGEEMAAAEKERKAKAKGIVKQAKIVYEGREGGKVDEKSGAGRSRGYGFIEYYTHRSALMGLRWLNGHAVGYQAREPETKGKRVNREELQERKKRLIVEFAIENAQVVGRRNERETKLQEKGKSVSSAAVKQDDQVSGRKRSRESSNQGVMGHPKDQNDRSRKRKRESESNVPVLPVKGDPRTPADDKAAKRERIIARKRMARRSRKKDTKA
ncbi:RNA recognition motif-containing protein [Elasticomyces elasticus]|nr:RNA recognition motif-containing protein [Elasticomyces elasticus]